MSLVLFSVIDIICKLNNPTLHEKLYTVPFVINFILFLYFSVHYFHTNNETCSIMDKQTNKTLSEKEESIAYSRNLTF
jgi:phosphotransferase system  glucose/maltose/N-acetylglucosamine-specific IIC component